MTGDHSLTQLLTQRTFPETMECFLVMPLHQINRKEDSSQLCFRCRSDLVAALVGVFGGSAMLWVIWTSGCYAFVFQQPIGIGPET